MEGHRRIGAGFDAQVLKTKSLQKRLAQKSDKLLKLTAKKAKLADEPRHLLSMYAAKIIVFEYLRSIREMYKRSAKRAEVV